jgi:hypothetical protein
LSVTIFSCRLLARGLVVDGAAGDERMDQRCCRCVIQQPTNALLQQLTWLVETSGADDRHALVHRQSRRESIREWFDNVYTDCQHLCDALQLHTELRFRCFDLIARRRILLNVPCTHILSLIVYELHRSETRP